MKRYCKSPRLVSLQPAARVAATVLLAAVALAVLAGPALASTTPRRHAAHQHQSSRARHSAPPTTPASHPGPVWKATIGGGTLIMVLLTASLLLLRPRRMPATEPNCQPRRVTGQDQADHSSDTTSHPTWPADVTELADQDPPALPAISAGNDDPPAGTAAPAAPSWLGVISPLAEPDRSTEADPASASDDNEPAWPDFLALAGPTGPAASQATVPSQTTEPGHPDQLTKPSNPPRLTERHDPREFAESAFSPVALRTLGARPSPEPGDDDVPPQRHQVALGDNLIEVVLAEGPAASRPARPRAGTTWLAATPYLLWAPLPYDIPDGGLAFACIGAGDEGCLFIDLAAAPGAVAIGGDADAAVRLAESIVHQLCNGERANQAASVTLVGNAVPKPHPPNAKWVATLRDLAAANLDSPPDRPEIVFCEVRSSEDASVLAHHVDSSQRRVIPVVFGCLPGAVWSFTAQPSLRLDNALPS